ncbi:DNA-binding LytR/AlgR family response regulator [Chitinophaga dinghuensis]|uniref:DNA-binding LytR/AlgR family response regulator n=1 Tax=Chitinophaga dinghuensis TaxID=1539050 RepID=A0A327VKQ6_9BACT|nr:LytTR family DNA-binding domain-containing protein [Chitinophaga dinghuensis]RAJ73758.1 DNA-binding LytR/AlgR family response regulator [Chitinophaga dinghuensis]
MIKCLIADDEVIAQQILEQYILQSEDLVLVAKCRNAMQAFAQLEQNAIDLIFLDIEMPLVSGITFLKSLPHPPKIIFTTAYAEYALQGYELNVSDYLLKPFSFERFSQAVEKVRQQLASRKPETDVSEPDDACLIIKEKGALMKIPYDEVLYIEGSRDYVKVVLSGKSHLVHLTMKKLESMLPGHLFVRSHKSYIVSVPKIKLIKAAELVMANQEIIPLSPNYKDTVVKCFSVGK